MTTPFHRVIIMNTKKSGVAVMGFLSAICSFASLLIYVLIPQSDLANSVTRPASHGLYALLVSPVLAAAALLLFCLAYIRHIGAFTKTYKPTLCYGAFGLVGLGLVFNLISSVAFTASQFSLGFAAPVDGTVWETLAVFTAVFSVLNLTYAILTVTAKRKLK